MRRCRRHIIVFGCRWLSTPTHTFWYHTSTLLVVIWLQLFSLIRCHLISQHPTTLTCHFFGNEFFLPWVLVGLLSACLLSVAKAGQVGPLCVREGSILDRLSTRRQKVWSGQVDLNSKPVFFPLVALAQFFSNFRPPQLDSLTNNLRVWVILQYFSYHTLLFWRLPPVPLLSFRSFNWWPTLASPTGSQRVTSFAIRSNLFFFFFFFSLYCQDETDKKKQRMRRSRTLVPRPIERKLAMLIGGYWSVKSSAVRLIKCRLCIPFLIEGIERIIHSRRAGRHRRLFFPDRLYNGRPHNNTQSNICVYVRIVCCKAEEMWCVIDSSAVFKKTFFFPDPTTSSLS